MDVQNVPRCVGQFVQENKTQIEEYEKCQDYFLDMVQWVARKQPMR